MGEDQCRIRRENAVENLASVRHVALNLLKSTKMFHAGIKRMQQKQIDVIFNVKTLCTR